MANEFKKFAKALDKYVTTEARRAGVTAINRAMASTQVQAVRTGAEATGAKQKDIKKRILQFKANIRRISGAVIAYAKPLPLSIFSPKTKVVKTPKGRRIGVTIKTANGRQLVPAASMATYNSGKVSIFTRLMGGKIKNLFSDALIKHISKPDILRQLTGKAQGEFEKQWKNELRRRKLSDSE